MVKDKVVKATKNEKAFMERMGWQRMTRSRRKKLRNFELAAADIGDRSKRRKLRNFEL